MADPEPVQARQERVRTITAPVHLPEAEAAAQRHRRLPRAAGQRQAQNLRPALDRRSLNQAEASNRLRSPALPAEDRVREAQAVPAARGVQVLLAAGRHPLLAEVHQAVVRAVHRADLHEAAADNHDIQHYTHNGCGYSRARCG